MELTVRYEFAKSITPLKECSVIGQIILLWEPEIVQKLLKMLTAAALKATLSNGKEESNDTIKQTAEPNTDPVTEDKSLPVT